MTTGSPLNARTFAVIQTSPGSVVNTRTRFRFREESGVVSASYKGGRIREGALVGIRRGERLEFRYAQVDDAGRLDGGCSSCVIEEEPGSPIRCVERYEWDSREGHGVNILEEIAP